MLNPDIYLSDIPKLLVVVDIVDSEFGDFSKLTFYQREDYFKRRNFLFFHHSIDELLLILKLINCFNYDDKKTVSTQVS